MFKQELSLNRWYSISIAYDDDTLALFIDNTLISMHAFPEGVIETQTGEHLFFGTEVDGDSAHFTGALAAFQWHASIPSALQNSLKSIRFSPEWHISYKYEELKKTFPTGQKTGPLTFAPSIGAHIQHYEHCAIIYRASAGVAFEMHGAIYARYNTLANPLALGYLLSDECDAADSRGKKSVFSNGGIYWSPATGAHPVYAQIHLEYDIQGESAALGFPTEEQRTIAGGFEQEFQQIAGEFTLRRRFYYRNGHVKALVVQGSILEKYLALGGVAQWGFPISNEAAVMNDSTEIGRQSEFENCTIYWSSNMGGLSKLTPTRNGGT